MPIAAFAFGSFGDIASILQMLWQLRAALNDVSGASAEIRTLTDDLDEFSRALLEVKAVLERRKQELQPGIAFAMGVCSQILQTVQRKMEGFRDRIVGAVGVAAWRGYWAVAAWSILGGKAEVDRLRARLFEQLDVVRVYLAVSQCNDQGVLHETMQVQRASVDRLYGIVQDIQTRFDVGLPSFLFSGQRRQGTYVYQPCARTSLQRFLDLGRAYSGGDSWCDDNFDPTKLGPKQNTYITKYRLHGQDKLSEWCYLPSLEFQCLWFRESAFGEWQALIGVPAGRIDTQQLLKTILERRHDIGAPCTCDGGQCSKRFAESIAASRLRITLANSYSEAANTIIQNIDHDSVLATDTDSTLSRLFRGRPDPAYVQTHVTPQVGNCEYVEEMFELLHAAPRLTGKELRWAANFHIGPRLSPLICPWAPWRFAFGREDADAVLPTLL